MVVGGGGNSAPSPQTRPVTAAVHDASTGGLRVDLAAASALTPAAASGVGSDGDGYSLFTALQAPLLASSPMNRPFSTDGSNSGSNSGAPSEEGKSYSIAAHDGVSDNGGDSTSTSSGSSGGNPLMEAWAAASAAAADARVAAAAAEAAAMSAAASASVAAKGAALAEENTLVEALREVHGALMAGREDAAGAGAEVGRVAAGVGLASALLGALRALKRRGDDGGDGGGGSASNGLCLAKEVKHYLRVGSNVSVPVWCEYRSM